eukprot:gene2123-2733_t
MGRCQRTVLLCVRIRQEQREEWAAAPAAEPTASARRVELRSPQALPHRAHRPGAGAAPAVGDG